MKKSIYLLGLLLLAACANDDEPTGQQVQNTYPLTIEVTENPLIPDGEEGSHTRAAITDNSSFATFYLNYQYNTTYSGYDDKQTITKTSEIWSGGGWPNDAKTAPDTKVAWYAYTAGTFNWTYDNPKEPYVRFTVEELATNQKDLLVAKLTDKTWSNCGGNLNFTFYHACAALRFYVKKASNISSNTLSVSSVVLRHVAKQGNYYFNAMAWTPITTDASDFTDYTLYSGSDKSITSSYTRLNGTNEDDSYLFLIPQELVGNVSTGTYVEIAWKSNYGSHASGTARIPLSKVLVKGYKYDVKINVGATTLTTNSVF